MVKDTNVGDAIATKKRSAIPSPKKFIVSDAIAKVKPVGDVIAM